MKKIVLNIEKNKYRFFLELLKNFDFIEIEKELDDSKEVVKDHLIAGFKDLKRYKKGQLETTSGKDFLDEL